MVGGWDNTFNDFARIPWEDTPDFPKPLQGKKFLQKLLVKGLGYLPGVRGWDLRYFQKTNNFNFQTTKLYVFYRFVLHALYAARFKPMHTCCTDSKDIHNFRLPNRWNNETHPWYNLKTGWLVGIFISWLKITSLFNWYGSIITNFSQHSP